MGRAKQLLSCAVIISRDTATWNPFHKSLPNLCPIGNQRLPMGHIQPYARNFIYDKAKLRSSIQADYGQKISNQGHNDGSNWANSQSSDRLLEILVHAKHGSNDEVSHSTSHIAGSNH